jgi:hypothetical protein
MSFAIAGWRRMTNGKLLACILVGLCLSVAADDFGDIRIQIENLSPGTRSHGYVEIRATVVNRSAQQAHRVSLQFPAVSYGSAGNALRELTRTLEIAPNATMSVSLFCPPLEWAGNGVAVTINGVPQEDMGFNVPTGNFYGYGNELHLLISPAVKQSGVMLQAESLFRHSGGASTLNYETLEIAPNDWSRNWLGYSSYDGVLLTGAEWRAASESVRLALQQYIECGGTLLVFGVWEVPAPWRVSPRVTSAKEAFVPQATPTPAAQATAAPTPAPPPTPATVVVRNDLQQYNVGFGVAMFMGEQETPAMNAAQWYAAKRHWDDTRETFRYDQNGASHISGQQFQVVEGLTTPVRGLFLLMLLFVAVIGPLNLWLLARWRKRLWLLWTTPAISLATCLAVAAYALMGEGLQGYERAACFTVLDETAHRATTIGYAGFYAPLTPGAGLHYGTQTELTPILPGYGYYRGGAATRRSLDWTNDQHLTSGWVTARTPAYLLVRKSETRRERLTITRQPDGAYEIVNGLGAKIESLWLTDTRGSLLYASDIEAGAARRLAASDKKYGRGEVSMLRLTFGRNWLTAISDAENKPQELVAPGHYLAVLDGAPFVEAAMTNLRARRARTVVYGIPAQQ